MSFEQIRLTIPPPHLPANRVLIVIGINSPFKL